MVLNINHLEKIRLLESKIEEVQQSVREMAVGLLYPGKEEMMIFTYNQKIAKEELQ